MSPGNQAWVGRKTHRPFINAWNTNSGQGLAHSFGALSGEPVVALCGKVWVPGRDPKKFPVCPTCQEIYEGLRPPADGED